MAKTIVVEVSDLDLRVLQWKHVNPHQHIDDMVTNRINIAIKEKAEEQIRNWLADPEFKDPIPADHRTIVEGMELKSAKQIMEEETERVKALVANPDSAMPAPGSFPGPAPTA